jgi:2-O-methyltransferase
MLIADTISKAAIRIRRALAGDLDGFLKQVAGVIHVGANEGQERETYARHDLNVAWLEPIPEVFDILRAGIAPYAKQRAFRCLITEHDGDQFDLHVANNSGASSSILELAQHTALWPSVHYVRSIKLQGVSLTSFVAQNAIDLELHDALVLDTQGSEMLVLAGAAPIVSRFKFIKVEAPDFESYRGCCTLADVDEFMAAHGFRRFRTVPFAVKSGVGRYYDVVYHRHAGSAGR